MIIVADENMPMARETFGRHGEVHSVPGREIRPQHVRRADVLLVRSVTRVDESLLKGSNVRFVGSATIGTDHVDLDYLRRQDVAFAHAPGSNADSVAEYVTAALLRLCVRNRRPLLGLKVGIVGCGNIGGRLARRLPQLGVQTLLNDPPLAEEAERRERRHSFLPLEAVLSEADVVTIHVPLERAGTHPTHHLIDDDRLKRMRPGSWIINTCRGPVVDNQALKQALSRGDTVRRAVLDVWEREPEPNAELIHAVDLATPHIAGYAYDAKIRGTIMLDRALCRFLGDGDRGYLHETGATLRIGVPDPTLPDTEWLDLLIRRMYDVERDDEALRRVARSGRVDGSAFSALRRDYPIRREFGVHTAPSSMIWPARRPRVRDGLGLKLT